MLFGRSGTENGEVSSDVYYFVVSRRLETLGEKVGDERTSSSLISAVRMSEVSPAANASSGKVGSVKLCSGICAACACAGGTGAVESRVEVWDWR